MFCFLHLQTNFIGIWQILPYLIALAGVIISFFALKQSKEQFDYKNMEKYATKEYVDDTVESAKDLCLEKIKTVENDKENIKENLNYIRISLDQLIKLHIKEKDS